MSKTNSIFVCQQCGFEQTKWFGKCPNCNNWNSAIETSIKAPAKNSQRLTKSTPPILLSDVPKKSGERISTKIPELDRVLGGGIVQGQVILISGEPGVGKSTLLLQVANSLKSALYVSGEESAIQIAIRSKRLGIEGKGIEILEETDVDEVIKESERKLQQKKQPMSILIVDSIQTMQTTDLTGIAGSIGQVRECAYRLTKFAKSTGTPVVMIGHITKSGTMAGPSTLAHIVDTVLTFEGDKNLNIRLLRANKNRFGATDEAGIFEMTDKGLESLTNADKIFLTHGTKQIPGSCISSILQGTRPLLVEVQALAVPNKSGFPKKIAQGISQSKLEIMIAILTRRCGLPLYDLDIFVNIAGGIKVTEPSIDLAICLAISSAFFDQPLPPKSLAIGEVGLLGDIREVVVQEKRIQEAKRLGFRNIIDSHSYQYLTQIVGAIFKRK